MVSKNVIIKELIRALTEISQNGFKRVDVEMFTEMGPIREENRLVIHPIIENGMKPVPDIILDPEINIEGDDIFRAMLDQTNL